jgi:hypothetical protein
MRARFVFLAPLVLLGFLGFIAFGGFIVQQLWNWLLPALFGWPSVTFWQALGLLALCRILFGGIGMRGTRGRGPRLGRGLRRRWHGISPAERERFRRAMRRRFDGDEPPVDAGHTA